MGLNCDVQPQQCDVQSRPGDVQPEPCDVQPTPPPTSVPGPAPACDARPDPAACQEINPQKTRQTHTINWAVLRYDQLPIGNDILEPATNVYTPGYKISDKPSRAATPPTSRVDVMSRARSHVQPQPCTQQLPHPDPGLPPPCTQLPPNPILGKEQTRDV